MDPIAQVTTETTETTETTDATEATERATERQRDRETEISIERKPSQHPLFPLLSISYEMPFQLEVRSFDPGPVVPRTNLRTPHIIDGRTILGTSSEKNKEFGWTQLPR